jgi:hypothetical protein
MARLQAQPGAGAIGITIGDFATTKVSSTFRLAYLVRNTITNLTSQDEQAECFRTVAAQLEPGGWFVIENYIPQLQRLPPGQTTRVFTATPAHLGFEQYDIAAQIAVSHYYWFTGGQLGNLLVTAPLPMAIGAGPDGEDRRDDPARTPQRLEP